MPFSQATGAKINSLRYDSIGKNYTVDLDIPGVGQNILCVPESVFKQAPFSDIPSFSITDEQLMALTSGEGSPGPCPITTAPTQSNRKFLYIGAGLAALLTLLVFVAKG